MNINCMTTFSLKGKTIGKLAALILVCLITFEATASSIPESKLAATVRKRVIEITGKITDEKGSALPGVTIKLKSGSNYAITDSKGNFSISVPNNNAILVLSLVGFITKEVPINGQSVLNLSLEADNRTLDEIVVVGYGTQRKKEITTAVTNLKPEDFNKGNVNSPAQLLQGKVAGLSIVAPQGNPNGNFEIRLRGLSTLGANTQPLIIIDGVIGADLNSIDPNDIATLDVLKDGGAAAIYGTRGSSGVILITSKSGTKGKTKIDYNGYLTTEGKARSLPVMNNAQYLANGGNDLQGSTSWLNEITRTAVSHAHNLALSGGTEQTTYLASLNYRNAEGVLLNSGFKQLNGRLNLTQSAFDKRLIFTLNLASTTRNAKLGFDDAFRYAIIMPPTAPINTPLPYYSKYGGYFQSEGSDLYNPVAIVNQNINDEKITRLTYNLQADFKPVDHFTLSAHYARNTDDKLNGQYFSKYSYYGNGVNRNGLATKSNASINNDLFEATGHYKQAFGALDLSALAGYSYQNITTENGLTQGGNFLTDAFTYNNFAAARDFTDGKGTVTSSKESNKIIAFFGRINLNYDNTYFLSASLRREGSSRFGANHKWGYFPGVSAGVDLVRLLDIPKINQLKIRGSYGITGALPGQSYLSQQLYGPGGSPNYFLYNGVFTPVYSPQSNPNPDLKWETKSEIDLGLDFSLFDSRLNGTFDYYNRTTTGALITLNVPVPPNLYPTSVLNAGKLLNSGIELTLSYEAVKSKNFDWTPRVTLATYKSEVKSLSIGNIKYGIREVGSFPAPLAGNAVRVEEGKPIGQMIGWIYEGVDANGQYILKDVDGNGVINTDDQAVIGRGLPTHEIGFSNQFRYKQFDLNFFIRGVFGHDLLNLNRTVYEQVSRISAYNVMNSKYFDPSYKGPAAYNSRYLEHASFIKLDNFTLGYNHPFKSTSKLSATRFYVSGQNLFYITKYTGVDPEPRYSFNGDVLAPGVDPQTSWLTTRTFTLGINLSF